MHQPSVREPFFTRSCGLRTADLDGLVPRRAWRLVQVVIEHDFVLESDAARLSDQLFDAAGHLGDPSLKPRVVELRRSIHRHRVPRSVEWSAAVREELPDRVCAAISDWLDVLQRRTDAVALIEPLMAEDLETEHQHLLSVADRPLFRHALAQASPTLLNEIARLADHPDRRLKRRTAIGLTKFVSRAATKTSPYSTFTVTAEGSLGEHPSPGSDFDGSVSGVVELDRMAFAQILDAVLADPDARRGLALRINPSLVEIDGSATCLGRRPRESLVSLPVSEGIGECLRVAQSGITLGELHDHLVESSGQDRDTVVKYCDRLLDLGVLETVAPVLDQSEHPLSDLLGFLGEARVAHRLVPLIEQLQADLAETVALGDTTGHRKRLSRLVSSLSQIGTDMGLDWPKEDVLGKVSFHENAVSTLPLVYSSGPSWAGVIESLDCVRRWLALHDRMLPVRLALFEYVRHRFGPDARPTFLDLHSALQHDIGLADQDGPDWLVPLRPFIQLTTPVPREALDQSPVPVLRELSRLRQESLAAAMSGTEAGGVISTDLEALEKLMAQWPTWVGQPPSVTAYLQTHLVDGRLRGVVNTISGGFGKGRGRWTRLIAQGGGTTERTQSQVSGGEIIAEIDGAFGVSVNLRDPVAPFGIDYPFTSSGRPQSQRISLTDLVVDCSGGQLLTLTSASRGGEVRPVHLGMMADPLLPPAARLLLAGFGQSYLLHPSLSLLKPAGVSDSPDIEYLPRVELGDVVVQRAEWSVPHSEVPMHDPGETDVQYWLRLAGWLRDHGIPVRSFVRLQVDTGDWVSQLFAKSRKPMYLDLSSLSMVAVLENMLTGFEGRVAFEEAVPEPTDIESHVGTPGRVTEFVVELTERRDS